MDTRNTFEELRRFLLERKRDVTNALAPRSYRGADGWCSPTVPAAWLGLECVGGAARPEAATETTKILVHSASKLSALRVPTFHVGRDLLAAVRQTVPPEGLAWEDVPLPHAAGLFLFPTGAVRCGDGRSWDWVAWSRSEFGEPLKVPGAWDKRSVLGSDDGGGLFTIATASPNSAGYHGGILCWSSSTKQMGAPADDWRVRDEVGQNITPTEAEHLRRTRIIVANLMLAMAARPELREDTGVRVRVIKNGPAREEWTPNWIGRTYRYSRPAGDGEHASPRMHWRRGHYRQQRHGVGGKERKLLWIEPCLVGGE